MAADTTISSECCFHTSFKFSTSLNVLVTVQPPSSVECSHLLASKSSYRTDPTAQCAYVRMYGASCAVRMYGASCAVRMYGASCAVRMYGASCAVRMYGASCAVRMYGASCAVRMYGASCAVRMYGASCAVRMYGAGCAVNARLSSRSFGMLNDFTIIQTFQ